MFQHADVAFAPGLACWARAWLVTDGRVGAVVWGLADGALVEAIGRVYPGGLSAFMADAERGELA